MALDSSNSPVRTWFATHRCGDRQRLRTVRGAGEGTTDECLDGAKPPCRPWGILGYGDHSLAVILLIGYDSSQAAPPEIAVGEPRLRTSLQTARHPRFPTRKDERQRTLAENNVPAPYDINGATQSSRHQRRSMPSSPTSRQGPIEDVDQPVDAGRARLHRDLSVSEAEELAAGVRLFVAVDAVDRHGGRRARWPRLRPRSRCRN